jgi:hypothetical protein
VRVGNLKLDPPPTPTEPNAYITTICFNFSFSQKSKIAPQTKASLSILLLKGFDPAFFCPSTMRKQPHHHTQEPPMCLISISEMPTDKPEKGHRFSCPSHAAWVMFQEEILIN